jgi:hypothetical protein
VFDNPLDGNMKPEITSLFERNFAIVSIVLAGLGTVESGNGSDRDLDPARKIHGVWTTPFPVPVTYENIDSSVFPPSVATMQARLRLRWTVRQSASSRSPNRVNIESRPVGPLLDFQILDDGGQDPATLGFFCPGRMRGMMWGNNFEGTISSSRLTLRGHGGSGRGVFRFTSRLMGGGYRMAVPGTEVFTIPKLRMVKR